MTIQNKEISRKVFLGKPLKDTLKAHLYVWAVKATSAFTSYRCLIRRGVHSGTRRLVSSDFENLRSFLNINFNQPVLKKINTTIITVIWEQLGSLHCIGVWREPSRAGVTFRSHSCEGALTYKPELMAHAAYCL